MSISNYFLGGHFSRFEESIKAIGKHKRIRKNTILQDANSSPHYSYYVISGMAKLSTINEDGLERIMFFLCPGSIYPLIIQDDPQSMENYLELSAITDLEVIRFPSSEVKDLLNRNNDFVYASVDHYVKYTNLLLCRELLNSYSDTTKYLSTFLYLYKQNVRDIDNTSINFTQEQISKILGISRVQVSRILGILRDKGIITTSRKSIDVIDMQKLLEQCSDVAKEDDDI